MMPCIFVYLCLFAGHFLHHLCRWIFVASSSCLQCVCLWGLIYFPYDASVSLSEFMFLALFLAMFRCFFFFIREASTLLLLSSLHVTSSFWFLPCVASIIYLSESSSFFHHRQRHHCFTQSMISAISNAVNCSRQNRHKKQHSQLFQTE